MARIILINIVMFLLPFLVYGAYYYLVRRTANAEGYWQDAPVTWLFVAGVVLVVAMLIGLISFSGGGPGGKYTPPTIVDGEIVPGHIE